MMNDQEMAEYLAEFSVTNGYIRDPGKFEGEPQYVPYFWERGLWGEADEDDGEAYIFELTAEDRTMFPELEGSTRLRLWASDQGFVYSELI